jgi:hypothetical protein
VYLEPPSFDLGVEFQTQAKYMAVKQIQVDCEKVVTPAHDTCVGEESASEVLAPKGADIGVESQTLSQTPSCAKRKSFELSWTSPDDRFKSSTTSPASMSKILADGAVFARMLRTDEVLDMNIQPWEHDTTDSPVLKKTVAINRVAKSPWFHELTHKLCDVDTARAIWEEVMSGIGQPQLDRYMM